eukprot:Lithocolla_globosa_v1_NODE_7_length_11908_cov_272.203830.p10 type:complete len:100 gc:universal NODE_7_length_11908_cov_272.203830:9906-10205(+)
MLAMSMIVILTLRINVLELASASLCHSVVTVPTTTVVCLAKIPFGVPNIVVIIVVLIIQTNKIARQPPLLPLRPRLQLRLQLRLLLRLLQITWLPILPL